MGLVRLEHVGGGVLFRLLIPIWNLFSYLGFYKVSDRILIDLVLVALPDYCLTKGNWFSSGASDGFVANDYATGTVKD